MTNPTIDPAPASEIHIIFQNGNVSVSAPMDNQILCYGMLEMAKAIISKHNEAKALPSIVMSPALGVIS